MGTLFLVCLLFCGTLVAANPLAQERKRFDLHTIDNSFPLGEIKLPTDTLNGTELYSPNIDAPWKFSLNDGYYVVLNSVYFDLEPSQDCMFDSLKLVEHGEEIKICAGGHLAYISLGNVLDLYFTSDEVYEGNGFHMKYTILKKDDIPQGGCNSAIIGGGDGVISDSDDVCFYRIQAPPGQIIELDLKMLAFGSRDCAEKSIRIYRGVSTHGKLLKEICHQQVLGLINVFEEKLFIEYRRSIDLQEGQDTDFIIEYSFVENTLTTTPFPVTTESPVGGNNDCSGFFKDKSTGFEFDFPHYENDRECIVVVRNNLLPNHVVQVTFEGFDLEETDDCIFDSLTVLSGERNDSTSLGGPYCGESLKGRTFLTYGNSLRLEFRTDQSFALYGLKAKIDFAARSACMCKDPSKVCVKSGFEKMCLTGSPCNDSPCRNGGTCVKTTTSIQCYCKDGYSGEHCTKQVSGGGISFTIEPQNRKIVRETDIVETCLAETDGGERVRYSWTFNGELIAPFNQKKGFGIVGDNNLQINNFDEAAEGEYTCTATVGEVSPTIVFEYTLVESCFAKIEIKPRDAVANKGDPTIFACDASGATRVLWRKDGVALDIDNMPRFSMLIGSHFLKIRPVAEEDGGEYTCEALDENNCPTQRSAKLTVTSTEGIRQYCGISKHDEFTLAGRISRGRESRTAENPWHVIMLQQDGSSFCGASVISERFIMTAAHCIKDKYFAELENVKLAFGTTHCRGENAKAIRYPARVIKHPAYGQETKFNNDIALIELSERIEYGDYIRPICLQQHHVYDRSFFEGRTKLTDAHGKVAGCGKGRSKAAKDALAEVNLPYVSNEECTTAFEGKTVVTENMFCAGYNQALKGDACQGDSGGAFVMTDDTRWYQTGIVSHGMGCDKADFYGVFTHVGKYYDWIREETKFDEEKVQNFV